MLNLFKSEPVRLHLPDAEFIYYPQFFNKDLANELYQKLLDETPWQQDEITLFGKKVPQPRLTCLYGNEGKPYGYSGIIMQPHPWTVALTYIKDCLEKETQLHFTTVLLNLYRNEKDSNSWHADNEKELGKDPFIASISLGETRKFQLKHNRLPHVKQDLNLEHGSLFLMKSGSQTHYKHQLPKSTQPKNNRINLTFRNIL